MFTCIILYQPYYKNKQNYDEYKHFKNLLKNWYLVKSSMINACIKLLIMIPFSESSNFVAWKLVNRPIHKYFLCDDFSC